MSETNLDPIEWIVAYESMGRFTVSRTPDTGRDVVAKWVDIANVTHTTKARNTSDCEWEVFIDNQWVEIPRWWVQSWAELPEASK